MAIARHVCWRAPLDFAVKLFINSILNTIKQVRRCLVRVPEDRATATELLGMPWLSITLKRSRKTSDQWPPMETDGVSICLYLCTFIHILIESNR